MKKKSLYASAFACLTVLALFLYGGGTMADSKPSEYTGSIKNTAAKLTKVGDAFNAPTGIAFDSTGAMYVTNWSGNSVVRIKTNGERETIYDNIASPAGIVIDAQNNIFVSSYSDDYILKITPDGKSEKISDGYHTPTGIAFSNKGQLLVTNRSTGEIVALDLQTGRKQIVAKGLSTPVGVTQLPDNSLVVSQYSGRLTLIQPNGKQVEIGSGFNRPGVGIVTIAPTVVAVIDNGADMVRKIDVKTQKTTTIVSSISGAVALAYHQNHFYIGGWGNGTIYSYPNE